jgi:predicted glycosyltransferase
LNIWFDVLTPKQVLFFKPFVEYLKAQGNNVLCTSRQYRECTELAKKKSLKIKIVGSYGGHHKYDKLRQSAKRTYELAKVIKQFEPSVAVNFSSPEAARVSFGLGIPQVVFNDSPHAYAVGKLTIPYAQKLLCPWIIPYHAWKGFGIQKEQITRYRALDPVVWIKRRNLEQLPDLEALRSKYFLSKQKTILIRPEESKAAYMTNKKDNYTISGIESLIEKFHESTNIVILGRYEDQAEKFLDRFGSKVIVLGKTVDGLLGKPTISISPIHFYVDDYLIRSGLVEKALDQVELVQLVNRMLKNDTISRKQERLAGKILKFMEDPMQILNQILSSYITL